MIKQKQKNKTANQMLGNLLRVEMLKNGQDYNLGVYNSQKQLFP